MYYKREFIDLHTIYPTEGLESDTYKIKQSILTEEQIKADQMRAMFSGTYWMFSGLKPDFPYITLVKKGEGAMMSDTPMERTSNKDFITRANGDVLIFGLGIGLIILPLLDAEEVKSITVVELYQDLIDMVEPRLKAHDKDNKLTVVQGDCFEYYDKMDKAQRFDCIYGDIWIDISSDNWNEMKDLTKKYRGRRIQSKVNPHAFLTHWMKDQVQSMVRSEQRDSQGWGW
jgi:hypothetical protein